MAEYRVMGIQSKVENLILTCGCKLTIVDRFPYSARYCASHAKVHGKDVDAETIFTENPQDYDATDADVERVADYLKKGHVSEISEISLALGIEGAVVAVCINRLQYRGLVGLTTDDPHKFFINV